MEWRNLNSIKTDRDLSTAVEVTEMFNFSTTVEVTKMIRFLDCARNDRKD